MLTARSTTVPPQASLNRHPQNDTSQLIKTIEDATKSLIAVLRQGAGNDCVDPWQPQALVEFNLNEFHYTLIRKRSNVQQRLSPRELEIARLIASGMSNKSIGAVLDISTWTVAAHIRRMFAKLGVVTRAAMVARLSDQHCDVAQSAHTASEVASPAKNHSRVVNPAR
jgi:DNA-binding CsgD family transcriptional regulator